MGLSAIALQTSCMVTKSAGIFSHSARISVLSAPVAAKRRRIRVQ